MQFTLLTFQNIIQTLLTVVDFAIIWVLVYYVLKIVRNNSRTVQIFKGIVLVVVMWFISYKVNLKTTQSLLDFAMSNGLLIVVVIFQPELRSMLERLGKTSVFSALHSLSENDKDKLIDALVEATSELASTKTGALITLEQGQSLTDYIKTGKALNSSVSSELLTSIFVTSTPLHDGAVIIQGDRIAAASAYYPPTNQELPSRYGARHRAALGISEITDSITIVVSEETGTISIATNGRLREMDEQSLRDYLNIVIQNIESEVSHSIPMKRSRRFNFSKLNIDPIKIEKMEEEDLARVKRSASAEKIEASKLMGIFKGQSKDKGKDDSDKKEKKSGLLSRKRSEDQSLDETKDKSIESVFEHKEEKDPFTDVVNEEIAKQKIRKTKAKTEEKAETLEAVKEEIKQEVKEEVKEEIKEEIKTDVKKMTNNDEAMIQVTEKPKTRKKKASPETSDTEETVKPKTRKKKVVADATETEAKPKPRTRKKKVSEDLETDVKDAAKPTVRKKKTVKVEETTPQETEPQTPEVEGGDHDVQ